MKAHFPFFYHSEFLLSIAVVVHILIPYRLLILHSQSLSHSFIYYIPRHSPFTCQWTFIVLHASYLWRNDTAPLAYSSPSDGQDMLCLSVVLSGILLIVSVTELFLFRLPHWWIFYTKRVTPTFSVAKLVQAVFCKYQVPYSLNFFKNFLPSVPANKNFSWPKGEIIR